MCGQLDLELTLENNELDTFDNEMTEFNPIYAHLIMSYVLASG